MPSNRFFCDASFVKDGAIKIEKKELHHLQVMRCKQEDLIELVNGKNALATAKILSIKKSMALVKIVDLFFKKPKTNKLILAQALLRKKKLDLILEKSTELGVSTFVFFPSQYSEKKELSKNQITRMQDICISSLKQCGRLDLPKITFFKDLEEFSPSCCFFGDTKKDAVSIFKIPPLTTTTTIFIGPEKGFAPKEILFLENKLNAKGVKLSDFILRSETASIVASGIFAYLLK